LEPQLLSPLWVSTCVAIAHEAYADHSNFSLLSTPLLSIPSRCSI
jgi:hypothetical protein